MNKLAVLLVLLSLYSAAFALSEGEISALQSMHSVWHNLDRLSPPWNSNVSSACDGAGFYGIICSEDKEHVVEMYEWGSVKPFPKTPKGSFSSAKLLRIGFLCTHTDFCIDFLQSMASPAPLKGRLAGFCGCNDCTRRLPFISNFVFTGQAHGPPSAVNKIN